MRASTIAVAALLLAAAAAGDGRADRATLRTHSYLRIDGVPGASDDPNHVGWFDVESWGPLQPTPGGGAATRIRLVGAPQDDMAAAIAGRRTLHEALLQEVELPGGRLVRNVSFWHFVIAGVAPGKVPARSYAVTLRAEKVVCDEDGRAAASRADPCASVQPR